MAKNKNNFKTVLLNNIFMLKYIFKYTPGLLIYTVLLRMFNSVVGVMRNVYTINFLVDSFQEGRSIMEVVVYIAIYTGVSLISLFATYIYDECYLPKKKLILAKKMQGELYNKAIQMDLASYDNPQFYNDFIWAMSQSEEKALQVLITTSGFVYNITAILSTGALIIYLDSLGIVFAAVSCVINIITAFRQNKISYEQNLETKEVQRKRDYTNRIFYQEDYIKEVRLSHIEDKLIKDFKDNNTKLVNIIGSYARKLMVIDFVNMLLSSDVLLNGVYLIIIMYKAVVLHTISFGAVVGLLNGSRNLQENFLGLTQKISNYAQNSLYIEKFKQFLFCDCKVVNLPNAEKVSDEKPVIELKNVNFTYETNEEPTLHDINMKITPGEKIALVGYNGSGKSTLIKLIVRLYDPSNGEITLNGKNIKEYDLKSYRDSFGVVFQDFQLFAATIAENVKMDIVDEAKDNQKVEKALEQSGFDQKLESLEGGVSTLLTREFSKSGVNLSGGESQKVAIARVFEKKCNIAILDEPSSALDPVSEYEINQSMLGVANDKTVIFISHRLSTTVMADKIYMLEKGRIIEEGSHAELMKKGGKYAEMFNMQAEKYLSNS